MSSGIPQDKRAALWAQFAAGRAPIMWPHYEHVHPPGPATAEEVAVFADEMLAEYERRNQVVETIGGADLHFGLPEASP